MTNHERLRQLVGELFNRSHVTDWVELWPILPVVNSLVSPKNLAVVFGICFDNASGEPAKVQDPPAELLRGVHLFGVLTEFLALARTNEADARQWHTNHQPYFPKGIALTDPLPTIVAAIQPMQSGLETYVFGQLLWLKSDALSFLSEPGKPEKGWAGAYRFPWGFQHLPDFLRDQLNPCQLLMARLE